MKLMPTGLVSLPIRSSYARATQRCAASVSCNWVGFCAKPAQLQAALLELAGYVPDCDASSVSWKPTEERDQRPVPPIKTPYVGDELQDFSYLLYKFPKKLTSYQTGFQPGRFPGAIRWYFLQNEPQSCRSRRFRAMAKNGPGRYGYIGESRGKLQ